MLFDALRVKVALLMAASRGRRCFETNMRAYTNFVAIGRAAPHG
jgi:hypothetical protein